MRTIKLAYSIIVFLLLGLYLLPSNASAAVGGQTVFRVTLDDKPIGTHRLEIRRKGDFWEVRTNASLNVKLMFFTVYQYQHNNTETWDGNCLQSIDATTDDNGEFYLLKGDRESNELLLKTENQKFSLGGCIRSFAYWNPELLKSEHLLNAQTGEYTQVDIEELGSEMLSIGENRLLTRRIRLVSSDDVIDLWYANDNRWVALQSRTRGGSTIRYELLEDGNNV